MVALPNVCPRRDQGGARMLEHLPPDWRAATLLGRLLTQEGPTPVPGGKGRVSDISALVPTTADFVAAWLDTWSSQARPPAGKDLGDLESFAFAPAWTGERPAFPRLLSPLDLQCVK